MKLRMDRDVLVLCTLIHVYVLHFPTVQSCHSGQRVEGIDQTPRNKEVNSGEDATIICKIGEQYNVNRTYVEKNCQAVTSIIEGTLYDFTVTIKNIGKAGAYYCMAVLQNQTEISGAGTYISLSEHVTREHAIIIAVAMVVAVIFLIGVGILFYKKKCKKGIGATQAGYELGPQEKAPTNDLDQ